MSLILGFLVVFGSVFGGFVLGNGHLLSLWQPTEIIIITGAAAGGFIVAQPFSLVKESVQKAIKLLSPSPYDKQFFMDLLAMFFNLGTKIRGTGLLSVEEDIEKPAESPLFRPFPKIIAHARLMAFIKDNMRIVISGSLSHFDMENILEGELEVIEEELEKPSTAINTVADGFPGFGIVAAVLGIVHTMSAVGGDPGELGKKVAGALVGTFLGVLLSYGVVGPIGTSIGVRAHKEAKIFHCAKTMILAFMAGTAPKLAIEYARKSLYSDLRPASAELEEYIKNTRPPKK